jgi:hypothetical protein
MSTLAAMRSVCLSLRILLGYLCSLVELDSRRARNNRFTIARDARNRDPGPTMHLDRRNVDAWRAT